MSAAATEASAARPGPSEGDGTLATVDQLLRDRHGLLDRIAAADDLTELARTMIVTIAVCAAVFGASLGIYRGGLQILFAAVKMPLVILLTAAICTPALSALRRVATGAASLRKDLALVLSSLALGSLVLAALAPVVTLAASWSFSYHSLVLLAVGCCVIAGTVGLALFFTGTRAMTWGSRVVVAGTALLVVATVGIQMTWTFRPYVLRPRTENVPFIRAVEGSFVDSVSTSYDSARGVYHRSAAPLPGQELAEDWAPAVDGDDHGYTP